MKKFFILICVLMIPIIGKSQKYTPFNLSNGEWICGYYTKGGFFDFYTTAYVIEEVKYYCQGDTLINDTIYQKLYYTGYAQSAMSPPEFQKRNISGYFCAIRNDSINRRVWAYKDYFNNYIPLYNFNYNIGDSIGYSVGYSCYEPETQIISIDSVSYCNTFHKRYKYKEVNRVDTSFFIEGIGSTDGLVPKNCSVDFSYLICYSEKNKVCDTCKTPTAIKTIEAHDLSLFPNPTNGNLKVKAEENISSIDIIDISGKLLNRYSNINNNEAEISIQQKGVLIIRITMSDKIFMKKIIKK